jgi:hypothetical protein
MTLTHHHGPPSLRDIGLSPRRITSQNSGRVGEDKDGVFCGHMAGAVSTFRPETFFHVPKVSFGFHRVLTVGFTV